MAWLLLLTEGKKEEQGRHTRAPWCHGQVYRLKDPNQIQTVAQPWVQGFAFASRYFLHLTVKVTGQRE